MIITIGDVPVCVRKREDRVTFHIDNYILIAQDGQLRITFNGKTLDSFPLSNIFTRPIKDGLLIGNIGIFVYNDVLYIKSITCAMAATKLASVSHILRAYYL